MLAMDIHSRLVTLAFLLGASLGAVAGAQDFRVDTDIMVDENDEKPLAETLTVFSGDVVYDFILNGPEEITVLDVRRGRIIVLDSARQVQTTLTTTQLREYSAGFKMSSREELAPFVNPRFTTSFVEKTGMLELASEALTYRAKGIKPKMAAAAQRFREFADWHARLNAVRPGNLPPFGRIELNRAMAERQLIPEEIERIVVLDRPLADKELRARSRHCFHWTLTATDRKRIETVGRYLATFQKVTPGQYWNVRQVASR
jgi:hypothetical protein